MPGPGLYIAIGLALIHAFIAKFNIYAIIPEKRWVSFAGGVSLSYVFLEVFPEMSHHQMELDHAAPPLLAYLENHVYIFSLFGVLFFYGLDSLVLTSRRLNREQGLATGAKVWVFWIHIGSFAILNIIFGYLIQDIANHTLLRCLFLFTAVALHFFVIDHGLREHYEKLYDKRGRWLLTAAIMVGAVTGLALQLDPATVSLIWAFVAGSVILHILKRELPDEEKSCFKSFLGGTTVYTALLLLTQRT